MNPGKTKKLIVFIGFFAILIWATSQFAGRSGLPASTPQITFRESALYIRTEDGPQNIEVEVAETNEQLAHGLMYRTSLPEGRGMLFIFPEERIGEMWMKNTYIPLDMVFVDKMKKIACIAENTTPESTEIIRCDKPIVAVLELPAGYVSRHKVKTGQTMMYHVVPSKQDK